MNGLALPAAVTRSEWTRASTLSWLVLLGLGVALIALAGNRFNVAVIGWIAAVPWLLALRQLRGWRAWTAFFVALQLGGFLNILKIITEPIPWFFAPMFSVPAAVSAFVAYAVFEALRRRLGDGWGLALFPAITVVVEALSYSTSDLGSWGSLAYTQLDNLALLQVTSLFGLTAVSALLSAVSAVVAVLLGRPDRARFLPATGLVAGLVLLAHAYGSIRLDQPLEGPRVRVATVTTDLHMKDGAFPAAAARATGTDQLFDRTEAAIAAGAEVVVWNEGATAVEPADEEAFLDRAAAFVRAHPADVLFAYVVPLEDGPYVYENKYVWMTPDGPLETYHKHHPVPGEGAVPGVGPLVPHARPYGIAAGAICYDYDFPSMSLEHARANVGVAFVPSSDWRGIDPYHSQMAAIRGIEGGYSVVRPVRWATSMATDAFGRVRGSASYFEGERVMLTSVPTTRVWTLYSQIGEALPVGGAVFVLLGVVVAFARRRRGRVAP